MSDSATDSLPASWTPQRALSLSIVAALVVLLAIVIGRTAWTSDDAYITFRTIDNFLNGYGLRWNIDERVQSFTHPLWLLVLTPAVLVTGNPYLASLAVSVVLTGCAVALVLAGTRGRPWQAAGVLTAMIFSKSFTDYSTSGLENALAHVLVAGLMLVTGTTIDTRARAGLAGTLVGLLGMTRLDLLLLGTPVGLSALRSWRSTLPAFAAGFAPLVAWEIFSIVYYGVPFPNTAYAKLATGIPQHELSIQGLTYFSIRSIAIP